MRLYASLSCRKSPRLAPLLRGSVQRFSATTPNPAEDYQQTDIIPDDLKATLEAHRTSNRSLRVRTVVGRSDDWIDRAHTEEEDHASRLNKDAQPQRNVSADAAQEEKPKLLNGEEEIVATEPQIRYVKDEFFGSGKSLEEILNLRRLSIVQRAAISRDYHLAKQRAAKVQESRSNRAVLPVKQYAAGKVVALPITLFKETDDYVKPWVSEASRNETDRATRLSLELTSLAKWLQLTPPEYFFRQILTAHLISIMKKLDQELEFFQFGSSETGLATSMSDLDIGFYVRMAIRAPGERGHKSTRGNPVYRKKIYKKLDKLLYAAVSLRRFHHQEVVYARVPLLRMVHFGTQTEIQIVAGTPEPWVIEIVKGYKDEFPHLIPVFYVLKCTLAVRGLDEPREGGIGSYTLLMWIVAAFRLKRLSPDASACSALLTFLDFIKDHDTKTQCIGIEPPRVFPKRMVAMKMKKQYAEPETDEAAVHAEARINIMNETQPHLLCLQDPADPTNDLGRATYRILDIISTLGYIRFRIKSYLATGVVAKDLESPLETMVGDWLKLFEKRREVLDKWTKTEQGKRDIKEYSKSILADQFRKVHAEKKQQTRNVVHG